MTLGATFAAIAAPILAGVLLARLTGSASTKNLPPVEQAAIAATGKQSGAGTPTRNYAATVASMAAPVQSVIASLNVKGATASLPHLKNIIAEVGALQKITKDPIILGKLQGKQTEDSARDLRDNLMRQFHLTQAQADNVVRNLLHVKDHRR